MSKTLLSMVSARHNSLADVEGVTLESEDGTYGVRRVDTGEVVVPSGTAMTSDQTGVYGYEFEDPEQGVVYDCAFRIVRNLTPIYVYLRHYAPSAPVEEVIDSLSESADVQARSVRIDRDPLTTVQVAGRDMFHVKITASDGHLMPSQIFSYQRLPVDPRNQDALTDQFMFVATPFDCTIYPVDDPDPEQLPVFFRKDTVEFDVPSSALAETVWADMRQAAANLVEAYNKLDVLETVIEVELDGSGDPVTVYEETSDPSCGTLALADGDQQLRLAAELAAAIGTTLSE